MTSFIIKAHEGRQIPAEWTADPHCAFCRIIRGEGRAFKLYEDDMVLAVLGVSYDVMSGRTCDSCYDFVQISCR